MKEIVHLTNPDVIFHLAAQPLVIESYKNPSKTIYSNVIGTMNLLEAIRQETQISKVLMVTTDKVYRNVGKSNGYEESEMLGGDDPYSVSKSMADLLIQSWSKSFKMPMTSIVRGGNVIGGGDRSENRLIPDLVKSINRNEPIKVRNPNSIRPWQHVLDCLNGYLSAVEYLNSFDVENHIWNFGPDDNHQLSVQEVCQLALSKWPGGSNISIEYGNSEPNTHKESEILTLNSNKAKTELVAGVFGVLLILVNFDFGIAAFFSLGIVTLLQRFSVVRARISSVLISALRFTTPLILGLTVLRISQISTPSSCNLICAGEFAYLFGGTGFFAVPELTFGTQQTVLTTAVIGLFVGLKEFVRVCRVQADDATRLLTCRLLVGLSIFCLLSLPYFTNRSYAALLVQFFLPWTAVLLLLVRLILLSDIYVSKYRRVFMGFIALLLLIPVSHLRHLPPIDDISNLIFDSPAATNFRTASEWTELPAIVDQTLLTMNVSRNQVGLISRNAMPDAIINHILPVIPYNSPASVVLKSQQRFSCDFLVSIKIKVLIIRADSDSVDLKYILVCSGFNDYTVMSGYSIASKG